MLSVNLTIRGWPVLVVGGGQVGRRRAERLSREGAVVTVVDPVAPMRPPPLSFAHLERPFAAEDLDSARLAFACATPEVNRMVVAQAKARGVWVCSASAPETGDFTLPAVTQRGSLTFTVSTGGASPILAKRIAGQLLDYFDESYTHWVQLLSDVRTAVISHVADPIRRRELLLGFADPRWLDRIRTVGSEVARAEMLATVSGGV
ncbi:MAG: hypothetical protein MUF18_03680 [Fimbriiglobus sp.]|nr:hypothetical protein [Fimbriiglobus sp.]